MVFRRAGVGAGIGVILGVTGSSYSSGIFSFTVIGGWWLASGVQRLARTRACGELEVERMGR